MRAYGYGGLADQMPEVHMLFIRKISCGLKKFLKGILKVLGPIYDLMWASIADDIALSEGVRSSYLDEFHYHFSRYLGQITGTKAAGNQYVFAEVFAVKDTQTR